MFHNVYALTTSIRPGGQTRVCAGLLLSCAALLLLGACGSTGAGRIELTVVPEKPGTRIDVSSAGGQAIVDIWSPEGIGGAQIELTSPGMPSQIVLRLHLRGLEELRLTYGNTAITASLSSTGDQAIHQQRSGAQEEALTETSPYWMPIRLVPAEGAPAAIPLEAGYIEVEAPHDLIAGGQRSFSIHWIDFYR